MNSDNPCVSRPSSQTNSRLFAPHIRAVGKYKVGTLVTGEGFTSRPPQPSLL